MLTPQKSAINPAAAQIQARPLASQPRDAEFSAGTAEKLAILELGAGKP
jgi:hypothetical protein